MIDDAGHRAGANAWLFALAGAHVVLGMLVLGLTRGAARSRSCSTPSAPRVAGIAFAVALDGPALVAAWSAEAVLARVGRSPHERAGARACRRDSSSRWLAGVHVLAVRSAAGCPRVRARSRSRPPSARLPSCSSRSLGVACGRRGSPAAGWRGSRPGLFVYLASGLLVGSGRRARRGRDADVAARALRLLGLRSASPRSSPGSSGGSEHVRLAGLGLLALAVGQGLPRRSREPRVDVACRLVPRGRSRAPRRCVRVPEK